MEWSRSVLSDFIDHYRSKECLWKISSDEYKNKNLKNTAYIELVDQLKCNGMKDANLKMVKDKIQNIRRAVRKERAKVESSKRSGKGSDEIYAPSLWYYELLSFANDMDPLPSVTNLDSPHSEDCNLEYVENYENDSISVFECNDKPLDTPEKTETEKDGKESSNQIFKTPKSYVKKTKRQKLDDNVSIFMQKCSEALDTNNENPSEYDAIGISLAAKMKKMKPEQQIYAELLCQKVCAKALLEQLNDNFDVVDMKNLNKSNQHPSYNYDTNKSSYCYTNNDQLNNLNSDSSTSTEASVNDYFTNFVGI